MSAVYCCPAHALCDVDVPGSVGRRAREFYSEHKGDEPEWCGNEYALKGSIVRLPVSERPTQ